MSKSILRSIVVLTLLCGVCAKPAHSADRPNVVLVMADDQGWGQTGYYKHPILKTPNLDAMAANGLRFDRFYAAGPVCSPTRASVLTGRSHDRTAIRFLLAAPSVSNLRCRHSAGGRRGEDKLR